MISLLDRSIKHRDNYGSTTYIMSQVKAQVIPTVRSTESKGILSTEGYTANVHIFQRDIEKDDKRLI